MTEQEADLVMEGILNEENMASTGEELGQSFIKHLHQLHQLRDYHIYRELLWNHNAYLDQELVTKLQDMQ